MRLWLTVTIAGAASFAFCQQPILGRLDATVVVTQHPTGAQLVEVTMLDGAFPLEALRADIEDLGDRIGCRPRGLQIYQASMRANDPAMSFVKAKFAVDGLCDATKGSYRLEPIVRAFAVNRSSHAVERLLVTFAGQKATNVTLQKWDTAAVQVRGRYVEDPKGLEYFVAIQSSRPEEIVIPDVYTPPTPRREAASSSRAGPALLASIVVAGLALTALVYFALIRNLARTRR